MSCLDSIFDFKIRKLNILLQVDFRVGHFDPLPVGHLGWRVRQRDRFEVCFFGSGGSEGVVGLFLGLQNYGSLEALT